jgi:hypothetical protein
MGQSHVLHFTILEESTLYDVLVGLATYADITHKGFTEPARLRAQNHLVCMECKLSRLAIADGNIR